MTRQEYAVFVGSKWARFTNKRRAVVVAKEQHGEVRAMPYDHANMAWDATTFYTCSDRIADFRPTNTE